MAAEVGVRRLKNEASALIERVESGEVVTVTKRGRPVARLVPAAISPGMAELIAEGRIRWSGGTPATPEPVELEARGKTAAEYVIEGR
jgi:prevent-host-death family protein